MLESNLVFKEDTVHNAITSVGNKVVPRRKAVQFATHLWLEAFADHFSEFVDRARERVHPLAQSYAIADLGTLETKLLDNFGLDRKLEGDPPSVTLRFCAHGKAMLSQVPSSVDAYVVLRKFLFQHNLDFKSAIAGTVAKIQVVPTVPIEMTFTADPEQAVIVATFKNLGALGEKQYKLAPYDFSQALMRAIEKLIYGEPDRFHDLTGNLVPLADRIQMSERLSTAARKVATEKGVGAAAVARGGNSGSWFDKLRRAMS